MRVECDDMKVLLTVDSAQRVRLSVDSGSGPVTTVDTVLNNIERETHAPNNVQVAVIGGDLGLMINGFPLPSIHLENTSDRSVTMLAYVEGETGVSGRVINHSETRVWRVVE
jgi:hypothetical protein